MKTNDDLMVHLIGILIEPVDVSNMLFVNPTIDITHLAVVIPVMSNMLQLASWNFNGKYEVSFLHGEVVVMKNPCLVIRKVKPNWRIFSA